MIFRQVRELFIFTNRERNGLLVLSFLLIVSVCIDLMLPRMLPERTYDLSEWQAKTEAFYAGRERQPAAADFRVAEFNPNRVVRKDLDQMGIPAGLAGVWINYLAKGGKFRTREDLRKLYGMTDLIYARLESHVSIPGPVAARQMAGGKPPGGGTAARTGFPDSLRHSFSREKKSTAAVGINRADSAMLEALPGIGAVLASRIIRYRKLLGGFYEVGQLKEIYGMSGELWLKASPFLVADTIGLKKVEINFLSLSELGRHPYIGFRTARRLVSRRDASGKFRNGEELRPFFSEDSLRRLLPYIRFEESSF